MSETFGLWINFQGHGELLKITRIRLLWILNLAQFFKRKFSSGGNEFQEFFFSRAFLCLALISINLWLIKSESANTFTRLWLKMYTLRLNKSEWNASDKKKTLGCFRNQCRSINGNRKLAWRAAKLPNEKRIWPQIWPQALLYNSVWRTFWKETFQSSRL